MRISRYHIILIFLFVCVGIAYTQERHVKFEIDFCANGTVIDSTYLENAKNLQELVEFLKNINTDSLSQIEKVELRGTASPEGSEELNRRLAQQRLFVLEKLIQHNTQIADSLIIKENGYIDWEWLMTAVDSSDCKKAESILNILTQEEIFVEYPYWHDRHIDSRVLQLMSLDGGSVWQELCKSLFVEMRSAEAILTTYKRKYRIDTTSTPIESGALNTYYYTPDTTSTPLYTTPYYWSFTPQLRIKSNAIMWGLGVSNGGVEMDVAEHWSVALPFYYSAWNYFTQTIKFRTLATQPEVRYWFAENNYGLYVGAHLGVASYNVAVDGGLRYQDHNGTCPALGGGVGVGYRMPINNNPRWSIEFMLGLGAYWLKYDTFYNVKNGKYAGTNTMTYWGVDNVAVNISYNINLKQRKR